MKTAHIFVMALILTVPSIALAFTSHGGDSLNVSIPLSDDLYIAGNRVSIQTSITGDLIAAGADISSEWSISESVMAAGGNLDIGGSIGDDLRAVGGNIRIHSMVTGDVVVAGGNIDIRKDSIISKDLVVAAGNVYMDGTVKGKVQIMAGKVYLNGIVEKDAKIVAEEIIVGSGAQIRGNLVYESTKVNPALEGIVSGAKQFSQNSLKKKEFKDTKTTVLKFIFSYILLKILFLTVFWYILYCFMEKYIHEVSSIVTKSPWMSLFTGIAFFVLVPIIALLLTFTLIGIPVAILMITVLACIFAFYELIGTVIWSAWAIDRYTKGRNDSKWRKLLLIFGFSLLFGIISGIDIVFAWVAIGALLTRHWRLIESIRK